MGQDLSDDSGRVRPLMVWLITIYYGLAALLTGLAFLSIRTGQVPFSDAQATYFQRLGSAEWMQTALSVILSLIFAVQLFRLRASAVSFLAAAFALNVAATIWQGVSTNWVEVAGTSGLVGTAIGWAVMIAILGYCQRLRARGLLI